MKQFMSQNKTQMTFFLTRYTELWSQKARASRETLRLCVFSLRSFLIAQIVPGYFLIFF